MTIDSKGRELFIVDNRVSGWTGLRYLEEWSGIAKAFDITTGHFEIVGKSMEPAIRDVLGTSSELPSTARAKARSSSSSFAMTPTRRPDSATPSSATRAKRRRRRTLGVTRRITFEPVNPDFEPIVLTGADEDELQVIAELFEVLRG